jgi:hypothetical protein
MTTLQLHGSYIQAFRKLRLNVQLPVKTRIHEWNGLTRTLDSSLVVECLESERREVEVVESEK